MKWNDRIKGAIVCRENADAPERCRLSKTRRVPDRDIECPANSGANNRKNSTHRREKSSAILEFIRFFRLQSVVKQCIIDRCKYVCLWGEKWLQATKNCSNHRSNDRCMTITICRNIRQTPIIFALTRKDINSNLHAIRYAQCLWGRYHPNASPSKIIAE